MRPLSRPTAKVCMGDCFNVCNSGDQTDCGLRAILGSLNCFVCYSAEKRQLPVKRFTIAPTSARILDLIITHTTDVLPLSFSILESIRTFARREHCLDIYRGAIQQF